MTDGDTKPHDGAPEKPKTAVARSGPPGRRFGDDEISRILQTAAELEERSHALTLDSSRGLTLEELRQVAQEAGIDPRFVDVAASHLNAPVERQVSRLAGGAYMWHFQSQVDGEIRDVDRDRILQAIRSVIGQKGELADVFGRMEWSHDDGSGPVIIGISSRDGGTEIDVTATKSTEAGIVHALGISFGGIFRRCHARRSARRQWAVCASSGRHDGRRIVRSDPARLADAIGVVGAPVETRHRASFLDRSGRRDAFAQ